MHVYFFQIICYHEMRYSFALVGKIVPRVDDDHHNYRAILIEETVLCPDLKGERERDVIVNANLMQRNRRMVRT